MTDNRMTAEEFDEQFEQLHALDGEQRPARVEELRDEYGAALLEHLDRPLESDEESRRTVAVALLSGWLPDTDTGKERLAELVAGMLPSDRRDVREAAVEILEGRYNLKELITYLPGDALAAALAASIDAFEDEIHSLNHDRVVSLMKNLRLDDEAVIETLDAALDAPFESTRKRAAELIEMRGGTARTSEAPLSPWSRFPLALGIENIEAMLAIGAEAKTAFDPDAERPLSECGSFYSRDAGEEWSGEDPQGDIDEVPPEIWFIGKHIEWPDEPYRIEHEQSDLAPREVRFFELGSSQNLELKHRGRRRLFGIIGSDSYDTLYGLDLLEVQAGEAPSVYRIAHEEDDISALGYGIQHFFHWIKYNRVDR